MFTKSLIFIFFYFSVNLEKNFFLQKNIYPKFFSYPKYAYIRDGDSLQYFLPFEFSRPKKRPFCDFSVFVLFYVLFRISPNLPKFFVHFRNIAVHFRNFRVRNWARNPRIYRNGRARGICSDFVFILFIFGNMIQKAEFVYYCRKKVKKSIAI